MEQITIAEIMGKFWDEDINYSVDRLEEICDRYGISYREPRFEVWDHVPQYGYRLTFTAEVRRDEKPEFLDEVYELTEEMDKRGVELSVMNMAVYWFTDNEEEKARLYIYSTFKDKRAKERG